MVTIPKFNDPFEELKHKCRIYNFLYEFYDYHKFWIPPHKDTVHTYELRLTSNEDLNCVFNSFGRGIERNYKFAKELALFHNQITKDQYSKYYNYKMNVAESYEIGDLVIINRHHFL